MDDWNDAPELRIVLVGKTGSGKSATGNTILGQKKFTSTISPASETKKCERKETLFDGRKIVVIDTPGFFDVNVTPEETSKEVEKCVKLCYPGPHVIIQVMQVSRFTQEEKNVAEIIQSIFSLEAKDYMIMLFSRKDDLEGKPLKKFLNEGDASLKEQIERCGSRCLAFNNRAEGQEREEQVRELLRMIDAMMEKNRKAPFYTERMLASDRRKIEEYQRKTEECQRKTEECQRLQRENRELRMKNERSPAERKSFCNIL